MSGPDRNALKRTFDTVAEVYDRARPSYPRDLFDDLFTLAGLGESPHVLEVGCGSGQATVALAERGCRLTCVELGENLATLARKHLAEYPNVSIHCSDFESWESSDLFDLVFAATCWHWIDPEVKFVKAARHLKPGGSLAIVSSDHAYPEGFDPFFTEVQPYYDAIGASYKEWPPPGPEEPPFVGEFIASGLFMNIVVKQYLWSIEYTADQYIDLLSTHSDHITMQEDKREFLFQGIRRILEKRPGGKLTKHHLNTLHLASS